MPDLRRFGLGAPNEAKFGFVQACRIEDEIHVAGQVGKDNRSGEMRLAQSFAEHVGNALANVDEACALALEPGEAAWVIAMTVHIPQPVPKGAFGDVGTALAGRTPVATSAAHDLRVALTGRDPVAATMVGVPALSAAEYQIEISAQAHATNREDSMTAETVPYPESISQWFPGEAGVRVGGRIHAAGHVAVGADGTFAGGDEAAQLRGALGALDRTLRRLGSSLEGVTSTHIYVVGGENLDFDALCAAHRTGVGASRPAATLILVDSLPVPSASVMVTATAV